MAVTISNSYEGVAAFPYITAALLELNSLSNGFFTVKQFGNAGVQNIQRLNLTGGFVDATCAGDPTGDINLTEVKLTPQPIQNITEACKLTFLNDWNAANMGSDWRNFPQEVSKSIVAEMIGKSMASIETTLYSGVEATDGEFNGIETILSLDATLPAAQEIAGATVSATNVIDEIGSVIDAIPNAVYTSEDAQVGVSINVYRALVRALGLVGSEQGIQNNSVTWSDGKTDIRFDGILIKRCNGMSENVMIAATSDNIIFGTATLANLDYVKVLDLSETSMSENVQFGLKFSGTTAVVYAKDVVTYGIVNSAN